MPQESPPHLPWPSSPFFFPSQGLLQPLVSGAIAPSGETGLPCARGVATGAAAPTNSVTVLLPAFAIHTLPLRSTAIPLFGPLIAPKALNPSGGLSALPKVLSSVTLLPL